MSVNPSVDETKRTDFNPDSIIRDYRIAYQSRQASLIGRKEVLTGKAKFGIFGDGKEVAQLAMARAFRNGDFRSGYYRDQTFMMAAGMATLEQFFGQLYADTDPEHDPFSAGRSMNCHFSSRSVDEEGNWRNLTTQLNTASDISPTASQMPRLVGLAYASRLYRELEGLKEVTQFSSNGDEIAFGTIGNASCAEGMFWESINAGGVLKAPMLVSIWDDGYGISVPNEFQHTKGNLSDLLSGFRRHENTREGYDIYTVRGWDYPTLCETYLNATSIVRMEHVPAIIHVIEVTQPQGHSTSGSHERYKSKERLQWEDDYCCLKKMREWMVEQGIATAEQLDQWEEEDRTLVREAQRNAWAAYRAPIDVELKQLVAIMEELAEASPRRTDIKAIIWEMQKSQAPFRRDLLRGAMNALVVAREENSPAVRRLAAWRDAQDQSNRERYGSHLYAEGEKSALAINVVPPVFHANSPQLRGFEVLNACFDAALARHPNLIAFGEDVGQLGDVNQGFAGLQKKYGKLRVSDTGIREVTIMGQAIGMAMRGLRPIAEIQYLDYILYGLQLLSDDLATLRWRTRGGQMAPVIVRTRGHRLEGIWHSGSPMGGIINLVRGMWVCVPRNMTQAAGMYNTLLQSNDPAIVIEVLNAYRNREMKPDNVDSFTVPLGVPDILREGSDVTIVTYGASCRIALEAAELLEDVEIEAEVIDVQTLLPFDSEGTIVQSLKKTSRIVFLDEDVPGGGSAFMMQQVLEAQRGYDWLDSEPRTITARDHRPAYGSDGDYWSKPSREEIFRVIYELMNESDPRRYPMFY